MTMDLSTWRYMILNAIIAIRKEEPASLIHLVYTPELQDPLELIEDNRRDMAPIRAPKHLNATAPRDKNLPQLITLDCRRVATYLLETDPGVDDPVFEQSVTQSFAERLMEQSHDHELANDERDYSGYTIAGWIISSQSAGVLAQRLYVCSVQQGTLVRWTNPSVLSSLWPTMTSEQRCVLLGDATWLAFDGGGLLQRYTASLNANGAPKVNVPMIMPISASLSGQQLCMLKNVPLVRDLHAQWKEMAKDQRFILPEDAEQRLHAYVRGAQQARLDPESVAIYVMVAVQLDPAAVDDEDWISLANRAGNAGLFLRDLLDSLPDAFWDRYSKADPEGSASASSVPPGHMAAPRSH